MKMTYDVKYRQPGAFFWRGLKNVIGDGIESGVKFFRLDDDTMVFISIHAEVVASPQRQAVIVHKMSQEVGQPVQTY